MRHKMTRIVSDFTSMEAYENRQFESKIYDKLLFAEQQAEYETKRYSMDEVHTSLDNIIEGR